MVSCPLKNEGVVDRLLRFMIGLSLVILSYFWIGGWVEVAVLVLGIVLLMTALTGFCGLYTLLGMNTSKRTMPRIVLWAIVLAIIVGAAGAAFSSAFFSKKAFLENFNTMETAYKQALYTTGNNPAGATDAFDAFVSSFDVFRSTYDSYRPFLLKRDEQFSSDLERCDRLLAATRPLIAANDMAGAHLSLEGIRPILNEMLRRNGLSPFAVALVDFHDAMEVLLDMANGGDAEGIVRAYPDADAKLKQVEALRDDEGARSIREALQSLLAVAREGDAASLARKGSALKSSYVKVYMQQ